MANAMQYSHDDIPVTVTAGGVIGSGVDTDWGAISIWGGGVTELGDSCRPGWGGFGALFRHRLNGYLA